MVVMTIKEFETALHNAPVGGKILYYTGLLILDREVGRQFAAIHAIGTAAWEAYKAGKVTLVQKSLPCFGAEYYAVKLSGKRNDRTSARKPLSLRW